MGAIAQTTRAILCGLLIFTALSGCDDNEDTSLTITPEEVSLGADGGSATVTIHTNAPSVDISNPASEWITVSPVTGNAPDYTVKLTVESRTLVARSAELIVTAGDATPQVITVTQSAADHLYVITTDLTALTFKSKGETKTLKVVTDGEQWNLSSDADWLEFNKVTGNKGTTTVEITAPVNSSDNARTATISLTGDNVATVQISVTQDKPLYPNYNTSPIEPDATGMSSTAAELAAKINVGWNLGNTLEAIGGETAWGSPMTSQALINLVKQSGFNAVRLPCSWNQYLQNTTTAELKQDWLDRVKEVIQYCVNNDMYVLLNIHWDGGWLENNCTPEKKEENNAKQKAFWEQIATHLRDFDEHLLFCSANEPNVENATQMAVLSSYHQTFVDAVRSTGGKNSYRVLVVQGPSTDIDKTNDLMTTLPTDQVADRMMAEVHFYTPYQFCLMTEDASWGKMFYYWGAGYHSATDTDRNPTWGEEAEVDRVFGLMKAKFVDHGIPVVLGEFGAMRRSSLEGDALTLHLASRAYFLKYVTKQAKANGILPFYWDAGGLGNNTMQLFNRQDKTVFDQQALTAIMEGATE